MTSQGQKAEASRHYTVADQQPIIVWRQQQTQQPQAQHRPRQAALLGGGVSVIALTAMLGTAPAKADPPPAGSVVISPVPASSSSAGFVTSGSQQQNTSAAISASLANNTGSSTTIGNSSSPYPNTATVNGNDLSAYATGNAQTNGVALGAIGSSETGNGIAVLAEQANTNGTLASSALTTINSGISYSYLSDTVTNANNGDVLALSDNLINAQVTGNIALSSVTGAIPTDYNGGAAAGSTSLSGTQNGSASGNVVVATSQKNNGLQAGAGSYASLQQNRVGLLVTTSNEGEGQNLTVSTDQSGNVLSTNFTGNSANNDIGVSLTSGSLTGAGTLDGSLTVANAQSNHRGNTTTAVDGIGAFNAFSDIFTSIDGRDGTQTIYLTDGAVTQDSNVISSNLTGNSAIGTGATLSPGNEITLGINLAGNTTAEQQANSTNGNYVTGGGRVANTADLALGNIQDNNNMPFNNEVTSGYIGSFVQASDGSSVGIANNAITSKLTTNLADNAINTATGAGINLISGLAALSSVQASYNLASAHDSTDHSEVSGYLGVSNGDYGVLNSSLTMANNALSAASTINQVTNSIALSASTINAGGQGDSTAPATLDSQSAAASTADAGLSLNNQQASNAPSGSYLTNDRVFGGIAAYNLAGNSLVVSNSALSNTAAQNIASNGLSADGSVAVTGTAGLLNNQSSTATTLAQSENNSVEAYLYSNAEGESRITNSSDLLSNSSINTQAISNNASNALAVSGGSITNVAGTTGLAAQLSGPHTAAAQAVADLAVNNVQQDSSGVTAANSDSNITVYGVATGGGVISNSSFTLSGPASTPAIQALSIGNEAVSNLSADASTLLSDTAGLVSAQNNSGAASATVSNALIQALLNNSDEAGAVTNSAVTVGTGAVGGSNGNIIRALAYNNQAANTLSANSSAALDMVSTGGPDGLPGSAIFYEPPFDTLLSDDTPTGVSADYGLLNDQSSVADAQASVTDSQIGIIIGDSAFSATDSGITANTAGNLIVASAFGNQADNAGSISAGYISADGFQNAGAVTNLQSTNADTTVGALLSSGSSSSFAILDQNPGALTESSFGLNNNTALTQAEGNQANNSLDVAATNISDVAGDVGIGLATEGPYIISDLAFTVNNAQYNAAGINPVQTLSSALLSTGGNVDASTLLADSNQFSSTGYANNATNSLAFGSSDSPADTIDTSGSTANFQDSAGVVNVVLGTAGTPAIPGTPDTSISSVPYSVSTGTSHATISPDGTTLTVVGNPLVFNVSGLSGAALTDFEAAVPGGTLSGTNYTLTAGTYDLTNDNVFTYDEELSGILYSTSGSSISEQSSNAFTVDGTPDTPAVAPSPSVIIQGAGDVTNSTLGVNNNAFTSTAIANNAVNTTTVDANTVSGGAAVPPGTAGSEDGEGYGVNADYATTNFQQFDAPVSASTAGETGISEADNAAITGSSLSVSNNTQTAKAEGNVADNTLTLAATNAVTVPEESIAPTAALVSTQLGDSTVTATAGTAGEGTTIGQLVTAPGAITDSTLTLSGNSNTALAVMNDVTNLVDISATNLGTANNVTTNATASTTEGAMTTADYSLNNLQTAADGAVDAEAVTQVLNSDSTNTTTTGLNGSTATLSDNTTTADAYANEASNTLNMTAANSSATGALNNDQGNSAGVSAAGLSTVSFALNGGVGEVAAPAATDSTINVSNNALQVQAVGNQATNALNADTGATYGGQLAASGNSTTASATYAVLNAQNNSGNVAATGSAQYAVALNSGGGGQVAGTTVSVSYNTMNVAGFGNSANNSMTLSALNSGNATAALQNSQSNTGNVSASIEASNFGTGIGTPGGSAVTSVVGNNSISASAVGNSAVNTIAVVH